MRFKQTRGNDGKSQLLIEFGIVSISGSKNFSNFVFASLDHQSLAPRQTENEFVLCHSFVVHVFKFLTIFTRLEPTAVGGELWIACEGTGVSTGGRAHGALFFCFGDQGVQHVRKFLCEFLFMCLSGNRP